MSRCNYYFVWCWTEDFKKSRTVLVKASSRNEASKLSIEYLNKRSKYAWTTTGADVISKQDALKMAERASFSEPVTPLPNKKKSRLIKELESAMRAIHRLVRG